jgi:hypothetical protein
MADDETLDDVPTPTPAGEGEPDHPGESADPLTAPSSMSGDEVHEAMVEEALDDDSRR